MLITLTRRVDNNKGYERITLPEEERKEYESDGWYYNFHEAMEVELSKKTSDMTKQELEDYAKEKHDVNIDRRKNRATLLEEVEALDNGNS